MLGRNQVVQNPAYYQLAAEFLQANSKIFKDYIPLGLPNSLHQAVKQNR
jgi:hypothetical protein